MMVEGGVGIIGVGAKSGTVAVLLGEGEGGEGGGGEGGEEGGVDAVTVGTVSVAV